MGRLSCVESLPVEVRKTIDARLISNGFGDYLALAAELRGNGYPKVSKSALHRYGQQFKRRVQMARASEQLQAAGVDAELAAELAGDATLVVVIDRRNGRSRLVSVKAPAAEVIAKIKKIGGAK